MALTITPEDGTGLASANSYVTEAEVDAYAESSLTASTWIAETNIEIKKAAIISASRQLTSAVLWKGKRATDTQVLAFPRIELVVDGIEIPDDIVPKPVKDATCEMAIRLQANEGLVAIDPSEANLSSLNVGSGAVVLSFFEKLGTQIIPDFINHMLPGYGVVKTGNSSKAFSIGTARR